MTPARVHADALRVGQRQRARLAGRVLVDREQAPACRRLRRYSSRTRWPGDLGATIEHVDVGPHDDRAEADVEAVREHHHVAGREVRLDLLAIDLRLRACPESGSSRRRPISATSATVADREPAACALARDRLVAGKPTRTLDAAVLQVQRVGVPCDP